MRVLLLALMITTLSLSAQAATEAEYIRNNAIEVASGLPAGLLSAIEGKRLVLLGEVHGTKELPALASQLITKLAEKTPLLVGLEFPTDIQTQIDQFMKTGDITLLQSTTFFQDPQYHSGRGSIAMVELLKSLRQLSGVTVFCFDMPFDVHGKDRDTRMAESILAVADRHPDHAIFVYTGNIHSRVVPGVPWDPEYKTMGSEVLKLSGGTFTLENSESINLRYDQGSAWQCIQGDSGKIVCGQRSFGPTNSVYATAVSFDLYFLGEPGITDGHQNTLFLRVVSASPPS